MTTEATTTAAPAATNGTIAAAGTTTTATQAFDWKGALGDSHATYEPLIAGKGWKTPGDALAAYTNVEKMIGGEKIALPGKDAKPEDWNAVYAKLGRPEKPEGYEFKKPADFAEYSDDMAQGFRAEAHKHGLSAKQAAALHDWWVGQTQGLLKGNGEAQAAAAAKAAEDLSAEIAKAWGSDKATKLEAAKRAARHFGWSEAELDALESKVGGFKMLDGFARIGASIREDTIAGKGGTIQSPAEARAELQRLESDKDFRAAYLDRGHPGHAEAVRRMTDLAARAAPGHVGAAQGYR